MILLSLSISEYDFLSLCKIILEFIKEKRHLNKRKIECKHNSQYTHTYSHTHTHTYNKDHEQQLNL